MIFGEKLGPWAMEQVIRSQVISVKKLNCWLMNCETYN